MSTCSAGVGKSARGGLWHIAATACRKGLAEEAPRQGQRGAKQTRAQFSKASVAVVGESSGTGSDRITEVELDGGDGGGEDPGAGSAREDSNDSGEDWEVDALLYGDGSRATRDRWKAGCWYASGTMRGGMESYHEVGPFSVKVTWTFGRVIRLATKKTRRALANALVLA